MQEGGKGKKSRKQNGVYSALALHAIHSKLFGLVVCASDHCSYPNLESSVVKISAWKTDRTEVKSGFADPVTFDILCHYSSYAQYAPPSILKLFTNSEYIVYVLYMLDANEGSSPRYHHQIHPLPITALAYTSLTWHTWLQRDRVLCARYILLSAA